MRRRQPTISVGLPVYNGGLYLRDAMESLLDQTFEDFELVICDNASTDETEAICRHYAAKDKRVIYHRWARNFGAATNFNRAFELTRARYFRWAAHDDMVGRDYLRQALAVLESQPQVSVVHSRTRVINEQGESIPVYLDPSDPVASRPGAMPKWAVYDPPRPMNHRRPSVRFNELLLRTHWCFEIFGLMRRQQLLQTPLHVNYYGSDKVLLGWMALLGPFHELPDELFLRRHHAGTSTNLTDPAERARWMDPTRRNTFDAPHVDLLRGYLQAALGAPLVPGERGGCVAAVLRYVTQFGKLRGVITGELLPQLYSLLRRRPKGSNLLDVKVHAV